MFCRGAFAMKTCLRDHSTVWQKLTKSHSHISLVIQWLYFKWLVKPHINRYLRNYSVLVQASTFECFGKFIYSYLQKLLYVVYEWCISHEKSGGVQCGVACLSTMTLRATVGIDLLLQRLTLLSVLCYGVTNSWTPVLIWFDDFFFGLIISLILFQQLRLSVESRVLRWPLLHGFICAWVFVQVYSMPKQCGSS